MRTIRKTGIVRWKYLGNEYRDGAISDMKEHEAYSGGHYIILQEQVVTSDEETQLMTTEWWDVPVDRE